MITISNSNIRMKGGLYSLNDLHIASGNDQKHKPANFMRVESTKSLITEIERCSDMSNGTKSKAYEVIQGGNSQQQGTYVCLELVYAYAMWTSAEFTLIVIQTFKSLSIRQNQLSLQFNQLCNTYKKVSECASAAGRTLNYLGRKAKPDLEKKIDNTLKQLQPSLSFDDTVEPLITDDLGGSNDNR